MNLIVRLGKCFLAISRYISRYIVNITYSLKANCIVRKMAQWLRALLVLSSHMGSLQPPVAPVSTDLMPSSGLLGPRMYTVYVNSKLNTHMCGFFCFVLYNFKSIYFFNKLNYFCT